MTKVLTANIISVKSVCNFLKTDDPSANHQPIYLSIFG